MTTGVGRSAVEGDGGRAIGCGRVETGVGEGHGNRCTNRHQSRTEQNRTEQIRSHDPHLWARSRDYLLIHYELWRGGGKLIKLILVLVCVFYPDYDRGRSTAWPVSPSQELWIVLGGVLRDSIRLLRN